MKIPKNKWRPSVRIVAVNERGDLDRPLYAGKVVVKKLGHYADEPKEISLPLVAWIARDSR